MSKWLIDDVAAGPIMGPPICGNGKYTVDFDRKDAALEQIEAINWAKPTIQYTGIHASEQGLPEGYGFDVEKIEYMSSCKTYARASECCLSVSWGRYRLPGADHGAGGTDHRINYKGRYAGTA